jgi:hypothetical protein
MQVCCGLADTKESDLCAVHRLASAQEAEIARHTVLTLGHVVRGEVIHEFAGDVGDVDGAGASVQVSGLGGESTTMDSSEVAWLDAAGNCRTGVGKTLCPDRYNLSRQG